ncbi:hypothetical protein [Streptomyces decoyicus]|uniref:hypothetical protein n=1 Tax=Streptomyces decoyicus TaxID=249567 RepID=UPI0033AAC21A
MPHSALRTSGIAVLATALAAVTATVAPSASAATSPRLKVLRGVLHYSALWGSASGKMKPRAGAVSSCSSS